MKDVVSLLADLVSIPTVNNPSKRVKVGIKRGEAVKKILEKYGFETDLIIHKRTPILLHVKGEGAPVLLFLAHFDVVPPGPGWSITKPFKPLISNGKLYGRGAADDKSNVAAITWALKDYKPKKGTIIIAFTGDEEIGGRNGAGYLARKLEKEGLKPDYLINGDGALSSIIIRRRSAFNAKITVKEAPRKTRGLLVKRLFETRVYGETMHSAYFTPGVDIHALINASLWARTSNPRIAELEGEWVKTNVLPRNVIVTTVEEGPGSECTYDEALTQMIKAILPLTRTPIPTEKYSDYGVTINPNLYARNENTHQLVLDIRAMTTKKKKIEDSLKKTLEYVLPGADLTVKGGAGYLWTSPDSRLVKTALAVNRNLGLNHVPIEAGGASDSRYFSPHGVEAIDYGPLGGNIHGPDEYVVIDHLVKAVKFYRRIAEKLTY